MRFSAKFFSKAPAAAATAGGVTTTPTHFFGPAASAAGLWGSVARRPGAATVDAYIRASDPFSRMVLDDVCSIHWLRDCQIACSATSSGHGKSTEVKNSDTSAHEASTSSSSSSQSSLSSPSERSVLMAVPFRVTDKAANVFATLHGGLTSALVDNLTSFHICEHGLPKLDGHVTSNMGIRYIAAAPVGSTVVALSQIQKAGKRLVTACIHFFLDPSAAELEAFFKAHASSRVPQQLESVEDVLAFLHSPHCKLIASGTHTKAYVAFDQKDITDFVQTTRKQVKKE